MPLPVLYEMQNIGVGGSLEAVDTFRFCCIECREQWLEQMAFEIVLDTNEPGEKYPEIQFPRIVKRGSESACQFTGEHCWKCGKDLEEILLEQNHKPIRGKALWQMLVDEQQKWIKECGGDLAGYVEKYHVKYGRTLKNTQDIYEADVRELRRREQRLKGYG